MIYWYKDKAEKEGYEQTLQQKAKEAEVVSKKSQTFIKGPYSAGAKHRKRDGLIKIKKGMLLFLFLSNETV